MDQITSLDDNSKGETVVILNTYPLLINRGDS